MEKLRKYIRKEIQSLHEQKSYPVPLELMDVLKDELEMRPLKRYINNIKAVNSIPPSYKIFLHNGHDFDIIYLGDQLNNFKVRISDKEYDLLEGEILKRPTRTDCKSVGFTFAGSNPALPTLKNQNNKRE